jgi:hypothetical protein
MLRFCLRSLLREYGWQFFRHIAAPHPSIAVFFTTCG